MKMRIWTIFILLALLVLTACASPSNVAPTPTIVRLDRSALTPTAQMQAADTAPTTTSIPLPSSTPAPTSAANTALSTTTLEPEPEDTPSPTAMAKPETAQAEIVAAGLNVREGPGVSYAAIGTVAQGDNLDITGVSADGNWLQIATADGKQGWISGQSAYVHIVGSLVQVTS
jgi:uncharacterized protein YgiM (DUF1202 family)